MIAGRNRAAAAKKALADKRRGLRVINRCSPLVLLWANPRLRLPPLSRAAAFTSKTMRNGGRFRFLWLKTSHSSREVTIRVGGGQTIYLAKVGLKSRVLPYPGLTEHTKINGSFFFGL